MRLCGKDRDKVNTGCAIIILWELLIALFIIAKFAGWVSWHWLWVLSPIWGGVYSCYGNSIFGGLAAL